MRLSKYFGDKPFWQVASRLALPIALQNVLTSSFVLVDTLMVSRLGDLTLSSIGMAGQWAWFASLLAFGLCSGMSVFVAQFWGVRDFKGIRRVYGMALLTGLVVSLTFFAVAFFAPQWVIGLFNKDPQVIAIGSSYLKIACISYPASTITLVMSTVLRNTERVKLPLYVSIATTLANAIANYSLIFGKFGLPALGERGAAIATCISAWLGPVLILAASIKQKNLLVGKTRELLAFGPKNLAKFYKKAAPVMLNEGLWAMGILTLNMIYSNMGYEYYAGVTIFKTINDLAFAFCAGLGNACVIMVGKSVGQGKITRALTDAWRFTVLVPLTAFILGLVTIFCREPLVTLFAAGDNLSQLTLSVAYLIIIFCSLEAFLRNIPYVQVVGVFRSGGDTLVGMLMDLGSLWLISIPATILAATVFKLPFMSVLMIAYLSEDIPKCILCLWHFISLRWLKPVTEEGRQGLAEFKRRGRNHDRNKRYPL